jgi:hypothetical protein
VWAFRYLETRRSGLDRHPRVEVRHHQPHVPDLVLDDPDESPNEMGAELLACTYYCLGRGRERL